MKKLSWIMILAVGTASSCSGKSDKEGVAEQTIVVRTQPLNFTSDDLKDVQYAGYLEIKVEFTLSTPAPVDGLEVELETTGLNDGAKVSYFDCAYKAGVEGDFNVPIAKTKIEGGERSKVTCAVIKTSQDQEEVVVTGKAPGWKVTPPSPVKVFATKIFMENVSSATKIRPNSCIALAARHVILKPTSGSQNGSSSFRSALPRTLNVTDPTGALIPLWSNNRCEAEKTSPLVFPGNNTENRSLFFVKAPASGEISIVLGAEDQVPESNTRLTFTIDPADGF